MQTGSSHGSKKEAALLPQPSANRPTDQARGVNAYGPRQPAYQRLGSSVSKASTNAMVGQSGSKSQTQSGGNVIVPKIRPIIPVTDYLKAHNISIPTKSATIPVEKKTLVKTATGSYLKAASAPLSVPEVNNNNNLEPVSHSTQPSKTFTPSEVKSVIGSADSHLVNSLGNLVADIGFMNPETVPEVAAVLASMADIKKVPFRGDTQSPACPSEKGNRRERQKARKVSQQKQNSAAENSFQSALKSESKRIKENLAPYKNTLIKEHHPEVHIPVHGPPLPKVDEIKFGKKPDHVRKVGKKSKGAKLSSGILESLSKSQGDRDALVEKISELRDMRVDLAKSDELTKRLTQANKNDEDPRSGHERTKQPTHSVSDPVLSAKDVVSSGKDELKPSDEPKEPEPAPSYRAARDLRRFDFSIYRKSRVLHNTVAVGLCFLLASWSTWLFYVAYGVGWPTGVVDDALHGRADDALQFTAMFGFNDNLLYQLTYICSLIRIPTYTFVPTDKLGLITWLPPNVWGDDEQILDAYFYIPKVLVFAVLWPCFIFIVSLFFYFVPDSHIYTDVFRLKRHLIGWERPWKVVRSVGKDYIEVEDLRADKISLGVMKHPQANYAAVEHSKSVGLGQYLGAAKFLPGWNIHNLVETSTLYISLELLSQVSTLSTVNISDDEQSCKERAKLFAGTLQSINIDRHLRVEGYDVSYDTVIVANYLRRKQKLKRHLEDFH